MSQRYQTEFVAPGTLVRPTPGCEMRALPHLWMLATGRETAEHFCPTGFLDSLDRWEAGRRGPNRT